MEKIVETKYHVIENAEEVKKIFANAPQSIRIVPMLRSINEETFQPQVGFRVVNKTDPAYSEYYVADIVDLIDSGVDIKKFELQEVRL